MNVRTTFAAMALGLTFAAAAGAASAATPLAIAGLYNTGVDSNYVSTSGGPLIDQHWTLAIDTGNNILVPGTAYNSGVNGNFPIGPWLAEDATSRWVGPTRAQGESTDPLNDGFYEYSLTFNLTATEASGASFAGRYAADNAISWIRLNNTQLASTNNPNGLGGYTSWTGFGASTPAFQAGMNTLAFRVINYDQNGGNPSGLRVEFTGATVGVVPEPGTWALMILGFGGAGAMIRSNRRRAVAA